MEDKNKNKETDEKIEKMRSCVANSEQCKIIAKKLSEYIKDNKK